MKKISTNPAFLRWIQIGITTTIGVLVLLALFISASPNSQSGPNANPISIDTFAQVYQIHALPLPSEIALANEKAPLHLFDVRERLDRELLVNTYWQSQSVLLIKRSQRFFPVIEPILEAQGVPNDFKYLALIESGLTNVVSPAGAAGFWQILETTAKERGLEVNKLVDERYHLEKSTVVACQYLKEAYAKFGSWTLAAASYNLGMSGLSKRLEEQGVKNYYDLLLNEETSRYVFRILAIKHLFENAEQFGYRVADEERYPAYRTIKLSVDSSIQNLSAFAQQQGVNYKAIKLLNPWLRGKSLENSGKTYELYLPDSSQRAYFLTQAE